MTIHPSDVAFYEFVTTRKPWHVAREASRPRYSIVMCREYDAETERLTQYLRGQNVADSINEQRAAA